MGNAKGTKAGTHLVGATGSAGARSVPRGLKGSASALVGAGAHAALDEVSLHAEKNVLTSLPAFSYQNKWSHGFH